EGFARNAHGYVVQTLADLGIVGLLVSLVLAFSWLVAALRAVGATPRSRVGQLFLIGRPERVDHERAPAWTADRIAVTALFLAAIAYGVQALLDWTWFVPGPTVMALVAAGRPAPPRRSRSHRGHASPPPGSRWPRRRCWQRSRPAGASGNRSGATVARTRRSSSPAPA